MPEHETVYFVWPALGPLGVMLLNDRGSIPQNVGHLFKSCAIFEESSQVYGGTCARGHERRRIF